MLVTSAAALQLQLAASSLFEAEGVCLAHVTSSSSSSSSSYQKQASSLRQSHSRSSTQAQDVVKGGRQKKSDLFSSCGHFFWCSLCASLFWKLVDPVAADPAAQDNDKRNNSPYQGAQREGTKLPNIHVLSLSCRTGSSSTGSTDFRFFAELRLPDSLFGRVRGKLKGSYSLRGRSRNLLENRFKEPLLRTLSCCKTHSKAPSKRRVLSYDPLGVLPKGVKHQSEKVVPKKVLWKVPAPNGEPREVPK